MSVYFIACGGFIKVGLSDDPVKRCARLFSSTSRYTAPRAAYEARGTQTLLGVLEHGEKGTEFHLHQTLDDFYAGCEWFIDEPALREYLLAIPCDVDPDAEFPSISRDGGPITDTLPRDEWGGRNYALVEAVWNKRRAREAGVA